MRSESDVTTGKIQALHYPYLCYFLLIATLAVVGYPCPGMGMAIGLSRRRLI